MATVLDLARTPHSQMAHNTAYQKGNELNNPPAWLQTMSYYAGTVETHIPHADDATGVDNSGDAWLPAQDQEFLASVPGTVRFPPRVARPVSLGSPAVLAGDTAVGGTLTVTEDLWVDAPDGVLFLWYRDGVRFDNNLNRYTTVSADAETTIVCVPVGYNDGGATPVPSNPLLIDAEIVLLPPANTTIPSITGLTVIGSVMTCDPGVWDNNPTFEYDWTLNGVSLGAPDVATYTTIDTDALGLLACTVLGTNADGNASASAIGVTIDAVVP